MVYIIYKVTSPKGKVYIGKTCRTLNERKRVHESVTSRGSKLHFHNAIRKYGSLLKWEIIDTADNEEDSSKLEIFYIKHYDSYRFGYNMTLGGEGNRKYKTKEEAEMYKKLFKQIWLLDPVRRQKRKEKDSTPEAKAKAKAKRDQPEIKLRNQLKRQTEEYKAKRREYRKQYNKSQKVKEYNRSERAKEAKRRYLEKKKMKNNEQKN